MPIPPADLFARVGLSITGAACWGGAVPCADPGVYAVSLGDDPTRNAPLLPAAPVCPDLVGRWVASVPTFTLAGVPRPAAADVADFLGRSWLPDECVVYVGKATCLRERLGQFARHRLGDAKPHAGGHWLKALRNLADLHVFFCACPSAAEAEAKEHEALAAFAAQVSAASRSRLHNPALPIPFANREYPKGNRKQRVIGGDVRR